MSSLPLASRVHPPLVLASPRLASPGPVSPASSLPSCSRARLVSRLALPLLCYPAPLRPLLHPTRLASAPTPCLSSFSPPLLSSPSPSPTPSSPPPLLLVSPTHPASPSPHPTSAPTRIASPSSSSPFACAPLFPSPRPAAPGFAVRLFSSSPPYAYPLLVTLRSRPCLSLASRRPPPPAIALDRCRPHWRSSSSGRCWSVEMKPVVA
ncbi:hypothetical protein CPC08DRAFT_761291 [Agrocybe pediades]|nr:hypothetical protein CPC08DRAFT_761291 [Agrocybe pediades]